VKKTIVLMMFCLEIAGAVSEPGGRAKCVGGTLPSIHSGVAGTVYTARESAFVFATSASTLIIPYDKINAVEYGQEVGRRVVLAWVISPIFLLMKARAHFVTLGFTDETGKQQTIVLRVDKHLIRAALATLEARTGRQVQYQDDEARRFHHGG
jgi:hypothetical protein